MLNGTTLPMLYALLTNKKQKTYKRLFKMIKSYIKVLPESICMDFEKASINAARLVYLCKKFGCLIHLSQSFWRRVQHHSLVRCWYLPQFRICFKKMKALAFLPKEDVVTDFELIAKSILSFIQAYFNLF